jgi:hypothetical protein
MLDMKVRHLVRGRVAAGTVSTIAVLITGLGVGAATPAASAAGCSTSPSTLGCLYKWKITRVTHARARHGKWHDCLSFAKSPHTASADCQLGRSRSTTVTATLTGTLEVPRGTLSAAVGYQVQQTSSVIASYTAVIPAHKSGVIQWSPVFTHRRKVQQRRWTCVWHPVGRNPHAYRTCAADDVYRYVYTELYSHPRFRVRYHH